MINAKEIESALHTILKNECVEGEWFFDKDDNLIDRIEPLLSLLGGKKMKLDDTPDIYTKAILKKEADSRKSLINNVLGELSEKLKNPMESSIRMAGPTFFSDKSGLTYYINVRKSGIHNVDIGRSKERFKELESILNKMGFEIKMHERGYAMITGMSIDTIAEIINEIENIYNDKAE